MKYFNIYAFMIIVSMALTAQSLGTVTAKGDILIISGRILDTDGSVIEGAVAEIWQTDENGIYDHPGDRNRAKRDMGFQFFGSSTADSMGNYFFRTILPGKYEPRPPHIHVKVKIRGAVKLITQFYFVRDGEIQGAGGSAEELKLTLRREGGMSGGDVYKAEYDLIVRTGSAMGDYRPTPSQSEGPYYPRADVSRYDNDLANHSF